MNSAQHTKASDSFAMIAFGLMFTERKDFLKSGSGTVLHIREALKLAFKEHGGKTKLDSQVIDSEVVMFRVSGTPASHKSTVREEIEAFSREWAAGMGQKTHCIVCGDEPLYTTIVELWLESEAKREKDIREGTAQPDINYFCCWAVPFPGLFHAEKGSMFGIMKSFLKGFGLQQFSDIVLPPGKSRGFFKNGDNRDNRNVLFNCGAAIILRSIDAMLESSPLVRDKLNKVISQFEGKSPNTGSSPSGFSLSANVNRDVVTNKVLRIGSCLVEACDTYFSATPNGKYFDTLFIRKVCLNVMAFHVASCCGHTDIHELFCEQLVSVVHCSSHIKYQRLILSHAVMRRRMPQNVHYQLYEDTPGLSVITASSFTARSARKDDAEIIGTSNDTSPVNMRRSPVQEGAWAARSYVQIDEHHEMIIIRPLKASGLQTVEQLERAPAYVMQLLETRARVRLITGSDNAYGTFRGAEDYGDMHVEEGFHDSEDDDSLQQFDEVLLITDEGSSHDAASVGNTAKSARRDGAADDLTFQQRAKREGYNRERAQVSSVVSMYDKLTKSGFLGPEHLQREALASVLQEEVVEIHNKKGQEKLLNIVLHGNLYAALHLSVIFPKVFKY